MINNVREMVSCFKWINNMIQSSIIFLSDKDWMTDFPLCHIWSVGWRYEDIKIGQKDKYSGAGSAWPAFYFSVKHSWEWFSHWWSFQWRSSQFSAALPTTTKPSLFPGFSPHPGASRIRPKGATRGSEGSTRAGVWVAVPRDGRRKGEEEEEGGRALQGNGERKDLPASRVKHCMIQATVRGEWARGQRDGARGRQSMSGGRACGLQETVGERWREWRSREGWRADRCHSPGPQHRKSFILGSGCCRLPLSPPERSQSLQLPTFAWSCDKTAPTKCIRPVKTPEYDYSLTHINTHTAVLIRLFSLCAGCSASLHFK